MRLRTLTFAFVTSAATLAIAPSAFAQDGIPTKDRAQVHLNNSRAGVVLESRSSSSDAWTPVCSDECDTELDLDATYRITGGGVRTSSPFYLNASPGQHVTFDVHAGSSGAYTAGVVLTTVGSVFLASGALFLVGMVAAAGSSSGDGGFGPLVAVVFGAMVGGGATVVGLSTLIPGIILMANNGSSIHHYDDYVRPRDEARRQDVVPMPRTFGVPVFSMKF